VHSQLVTLLVALAADSGRDAAVDLGAGRPSAQDLEQAP